MRYSLLFCIPVLWSACQPIVIGVPAEVAGSNAGGEGGEAVQPSAGGADAGEASGGEGGEGLAPCSTERNLKLTGKLTTPHGEPIAQAEVRLSGSTLAHRTTHTDNEGNYAFEGLCAGQYRLTSCVASETLVTLAEDEVRDIDGTPGQCDDSALEPNVLLLVYDPLVSHGSETLRLSNARGVGDPNELAKGLADFLSAASGGHFRPSVGTVEPLLEFPPRSDGSVYTAEQYVACVDETGPCLPELAADVAAIEIQQALCERIWTGHIDEIWLLGARHFGFQRLGSLTCHFDDTGAHPTHEGVKKDFDVVGLDFEGGLDGLIAGYQERAHAALLAAFGDESGPYAAFTNVFEYPVPTKDASCEPWGCSERGYRRYWFSHLPRARWLDDQGSLNDWWRPIGRPEERSGVTELDEDGLPKPWCSSSYQPGWCTHIDDDKHELCNENEWATAGELSGFVEVFYEPKRLVTSVTLYDRKCAEQVMAGHIEFSDGSPDVKFGPLDKGMDGEDPLPTMLSFPKPKLLSGLRVVIDQGTATNPGFSEVTIASAVPAP